MSVPIVTFFNNKGGVGKTSLVYHTAWMLSELGRRTLVVDLDPQASLTTAFLDDEALADLPETPFRGSTIYQCVRPLLEVGDIKPPSVSKFGQLSLVPGELGLANFEDELAVQWMQSLGDKNLFRAFRLLTAFWQVAQEAAAAEGAGVILFDVGSSLGPLNRAALLATDFVVVPLAGEQSVRALQSLGSTLREWRAGWKKRRMAWQTPELELPFGAMTPIGYVVQQAEVHLGRTPRALTRWFEQIPQEYRENVLALPADSSAMTVSADPECLAVMKHFRSLAPMAQEARRPIFLLRPADGAVGSHAVAVRSAYSDFAAFTKRLLVRIGLEQEQP